MINCCMAIQQSRIYNGYFRQPESHTDAPEERNPEDGDDRQQQL